MECGSKFVFCFQRLKPAKVNIDEVVLVCVRVCVCPSVCLLISVQDGIYVLGKAHIMRSILSLESFPSVAFETVPMLV